MVQTPADGVSLSDQRPDSEDLTGTTRPAVSNENQNYLEGRESSEPSADLLINLPRTHLTSTECFVRPLDQEPCARLEKPSAGFTDLEMTLRSRKP